MIRALDSLHAKILKHSDFAEMVTEEEIQALVEAKNHNSGWIPCSERLPDECIEVLVTVREITGDTYTQTSWMQDGIWIIKKTALQPKVIAWQPLPEPCRKDGVV